MRLNHPVTDTEFPFPRGATLVSTTDLKGRILYCNPAFVAVSGYSKPELLGQPHNLIRHPDMPEEAFRDLWATIAAGRPWSAPVKNRRKDGSHYWVMANVTPLVQDGAPVGYMSVRTEPTREQVRAAETLYATMRRERSEGRLLHRLQDGRVLRDSPAARWRRLLVPGLRGRVAWAVAAVGALADALVSKSSEIANLRTELASAQGAAKEAANQMTIAREAMDKQLAEVRASAAEAMDAASTDRSSKNEQVSQIQTDFQAQLESAQQATQSAQVQIADLQRDNEQLKTQIQQLTGRLVDLRTNVSDPIVRQADGTIIRLASAATESIEKAMNALQTRNIAEAHNVVSSDDALNQLRYAIEQQALLILATQAPTASDLRAVIAAIHLAVELERIGDHAAGIARESRSRLVEEGRQEAACRAARPRARKQAASGAVRCRRRLRLYELARAEGAYR